MLKWQTEVVLYCFAELDEAVQEKILDRLWDINTGYEWWDSYVEGINHGGGP